jgi:hypothetical protein
MNIRRLYSIILLIILSIGKVSAEVFPTVPDSVGPFLIQSMHTVYRLYIWAQDSRLYVHIDPFGSNHVSVGQFIVIQDNIEYETDIYDSERKRLWASRLVGEASTWKIEAHTAKFDATRNMTLIYNSSYQWDIQPINTNGPVLPDSLLGFYPGGSSYDESSNYNQGIESGYGNEINRFGNTNNIKRFSEGNQTVDIFDNRLLSAMNEITVASWFKLNDKESGSYRYLLSKNKTTACNGPDDSYFLRLYRMPGPELKLQASVLGENKTATGLAEHTVSLQPGIWYHAAFSWDGDTLNLYLNGQWLASEPYAADRVNPTENTLLRFGSMSEAYQYYLNGGLDNVRLYNRALTPEEMFQLYVEEKNHSQPFGWQLAVTEFWRVAQYDFEQDFTDATEYRQGGSASGGMFVTDRHFRPDSALYLNGQGEAVTVEADGELSGFSSLTLACWFKLEPDSPAGASYLISKLDGSAASYAGSSYYLSLNRHPTGETELAGGLFSGEDVVPENHGQAAFTAMLDTDQWYHVVLVWDGHFVTLYLNGEPVASAAFNKTALNASPDTPLTFGASSGAAADFFQGSLDDIQIYRHPLSTNDIAILYTIKKRLPVVGDWNGDGRDEIGIYYINEHNTGVFALDTSGNGIADIHYYSTDPIFGMNFYTPGTAHWAFDIPISGDWDGDGRDHVGFYTLFASHDNSFSIDTTGDQHLNRAVWIGWPGDRPIVGDWDNDAKDDVGVARDMPFGGVRYYLDSDEDGYHNRAINIGRATDIGFAGDWDGDGIVTIGVYRPSVNRFYFDNNEDGIHEEAISFGKPGDHPLIGDWDGDGSPDIGVYVPRLNTFCLDEGRNGVVDTILQFEDSDAAYYPLR